MQIQKPRLTNKCPVPSYWTRLDSSATEAWVSHCMVPSREQFSGLCINWFPRGEHQVPGCMSSAEVFGITATEKPSFLKHRLNTCQCFFLSFFLSHGVSLQSMAATGLRVRPWSCGCCYSSRSQCLGSCCCLVLVLSRGLKVLPCLKINHQNHLAHEGSHSLR